MAVLDVLMLNAGFLFLVLVILLFFMIIKYSNGHGKVSDKIDKEDAINIKGDLKKIKEQIYGEHDVA